MRGKALVLCAAIVVTVGACGRPEQAAGRKVFIRFACENDGGATVTVRPWRIVLQKRTDQLEWSLNPSGIDSVAITPKPGEQWPFISPEPPLIVTEGKDGIASGIPDSVAGGTYKYNITGVCARSSGPPDTVVIDPDMIIPTLTQGPG